MESDGDDRRPGLIVVKHVKNDGSSFVFAWCSGVGDCQILNPIRGDKGNQLVKKDALIVGQWYSFRLTPSRKRDNALVAFAAEAIPIEPIWPASAMRANTAGRQTAQVRTVPVLVGAVQKATDVAVGWSPFFGRVSFEHLKLFNLRQELVKTGAMLSLTIACTLVDDDDDCSWAAVAIDEPQLASSGLDMQQMGVKKLIAEFATFDGCMERCWATGENGEKICFGACDFDRQQQQNSAVEFRPGDRFLAWIGERSPVIPYHRAFYVQQLLSSVPMPLTRAAEQHQQMETAEVCQPTSISPSISDLPFKLLVAQSSSPSNSAGSSVGKETTGHLTLNDRWAQVVEEATDDSEQPPQKAVVSREEYLSNGGRQLYARIIGQPDICRAVCQHDPAILSDMFALFNP